MRHKVLRFVSLVLIQTFVVHELAFAEGLAPLLKQELESKPSVAIQFPPSTASVEDAYKGSSGKLFYLLQDAHTNESGQYNLAKALSIILDKEKDLKLVFTEAGVGDNSLSFLKNYKTPQEREAIARSYMKKGYLHGAEYLGLTSEQNFVLWGVENLALYAKALEDYRKVADERGRFELYLKKIESTVETLKSRVYEPSLAAFVQERKKYQNEELPLTSYLSALSREAQLRNISLSKYPQLRLLQELKTQEEALDFARANAEHLKAFGSLTEEDKAELKELSGAGNKTDKVLRGRRDEQAYFFALEEMLGGSTKNFADLSKYFDYLHRAKALEAAQVLKEMDALEGDILQALTRTDEEKTLLLCEDVLFYLQKLFRLTLTPEEYTHYRELTHDFSIEQLTGFLNKKIMDLGTYYERSLFLEPGFSEILKDAEDFYQTTHERDENFLKEALSKMAQENASKAALITGGFHTPNLKSLLKARGISYVSVTPQVWQETNLKKYEQVLLGQNLSRPHVDLSVKASNIAVLQARTEGSEWGVAFLREIQGSGRANLPARRSLSGARLALSADNGGSIQRPAVLDITYEDWVPRIDRAKIERILWRYAESNGFNLRKGLQGAVSYEGGMDPQDLLDLRDKNTFFRYQQASRTRYFFRDAGVSALEQVNSMLDILSGLGRRLRPSQVRTFYEKGKSKQPAWGFFIERYDRLLRTLYARALIKEADDQIYSAVLHNSTNMEDVLLGFRIHPDGSVELNETGEWEAYAGPDKDTQTAKEIRGRWHTIASRIQVMRKYRAYLETLNDRIKDVNASRWLERKAADQGRKERQLIQGIVDGIRESIESDSGKVVLVSAPLERAIDHTAKTPAKNQPSIVERTMIMDHLLLAHRQWDKVALEPHQVEDDIKIYRTSLLNATKGLHTEIQRLNGIIVGSARAAMKRENERPLRELLEAMESAMATSLPVLKKEDIDPFDTQKAYAEFVLALNDYRNTSGQDEEERNAISHLFGHAIMSPDPARLYELIHQLRWIVKKNAIQRLRSREYFTDDSQMTFTLGAKVLERIKKEVREAMVQAAGPTGARLADAGMSITETDDMSSAQFLRFGRQFAKEVKNGIIITLFPRSPNTIHEQNMMPFRLAVGSSGLSLQSFEIFVGRHKHGTYRVKTSKEDNRISSAVVSVVYMPESWAPTDPEVVKLTDTLLFKGQRESRSPRIEPAVAAPVNVTDVKDQPDPPTAAAVQIDNVGQIFPPVSSPLGVLYDSLIALRNQTPGILLELEAPKNYAAGTEKTKEISQSAKTALATYRAFKRTTPKDEQSAVEAVVGGMMVLYLDQMRDKPWVGSKRALQDFVNRVARLDQHFKGALSNPEREAIPQVTEKSEGSAADAKPEKIETILARKASANATFMVNNVRYSLKHIHAGKTLSVIPLSNPTETALFRVEIDGKPVEFWRAGTKRPKQVVGPIANQPPAVATAYPDASVATVTHEPGQTRKASVVAQFKYDGNLYSVEWAHRLRDLTVIPSAGPAYEHGFRVEVDGKPVKFWKSGSKRFTSLEKIHGARLAVNNKRPMTPQEEKTVMKALEDIKPMIESGKIPVFNQMVLLSFINSSGAHPLSPTLFKNTQVPIIVRTSVDEMIQFSMPYTDRFLIKGIRKMDKPGVLDSHLRRIASTLRVNPQLLINRIKSDPDGVGRSIDIFVAHTRGRVDKRLVETVNLLINLLREGKITRITEDNIVKISKLPRNIVVERMAKNKELASFVSDAKSWRTADFVIIDTTMRLIQDFEDVMNTGITYEMIARESGVTSAVLTVRRKANTQVQAITKHAVDFTSLDNRVIKLSAEYTRRQRSGEILAVTPQMFARDLGADSSSLSSGVSRSIAARHAYRAHIGAEGKVTRMTIALEIFSRRFRTHEIFSATNIELYTQAAVSQDFWNKYLDKPKNTELRRMRDELVRNSDGVNRVLYALDVLEQRAPTRRTTFTNHDVARIGGLSSPKRVEELTFAYPELIGDRIRQVRALYADKIAPSEHAVRQAIYQMKLGNIKPITLARIAQRSGFSNYTISKMMKKTPSLQSFVNKAIEANPPSVYVQYTPSAVSPTRHLMMQIFSNPRRTAHLLGQFGKSQSDFQGFNVYSVGLPDGAEFDPFWDVYKVKLNFKDGTSALIIAKLKTPISSGLTRFELEEHVYGKISLKEPNLLTNTYARGVFTAPDGDYYAYQLAEWIPVDLSIQNDILLAEQMMRFWIASSSVSDDRFLPVNNGIPFHHFFWASEDQMDIRFHRFDGSLVIPSVAAMLRSVRERVENAYAVETAYGKVFGKDLVGIGSAEDGALSDRWDMDTSAFTVYGRRYLQKNRHSHIKVVFISPSSPMDIRYVNFRVFFSIVGERGLSDYSNFIQGLGSGTFRIYDKSQPGKSKGLQAVFIPESWNIKEGATVGIVEQMAAKASTENSGARLASDSQFVRADNKGRVVLDGESYELGFWNADKTVKLVSRTVQQTKVPIDLFIDNEKIGEYEPAAGIKLASYKRFSNNWGILKFNGNKYDLGKVNRIKTIFLHPVMSGTDDGLILEIRVDDKVIAALDGKKGFAKSVSDMPVALISDDAERVQPDPVAIAVLPDKKPAPTEIAASIEQAYSAMKEYFPPDKYPLLVRRAEYIKSGRPSQIVSTLASKIMLRLSRIPDAAAYGDARAKVDASKGIVRGFLGRYRVASTRLDELTSIRADLAVLRDAYEKVLGALEASGPLSTEAFDRSLEEVLEFVRGHQGKKVAAEVSLIYPNPVDPRKMVRESFFTGNPEIIASIEERFAQFSEGFNITISMTPGRQGTTKMNVNFEPNAQRSTRTAAGARLSSDVSLFLSAVGFILGPGDIALAEESRLVRVYRLSKSSPDELLVEVSTPDGRQQFILSRETNLEELKAHIKTDGLELEERLTAQLSEAIAQNEFRPTTTVLSTPKKIFLHLDQIEHGDNRHILSNLLFQWNKRASGQTLVIFTGTEERTAKAMQLVRSLGLKTNTFTTEGAVPADFAKAPESHLLTQGNLTPEMRTQYPAAKWLFLERADGQPRFFAFAPIEGLMELVAVGQTDAALDFFRTITGHSIAKEQFLRLIAGDTDMAGLFPLTYLGKVDLDLVIRLYQMSRIGDLSA